MSAAPHDRAALDRLLASAAEATPPPLSSTDQRRMVRHAVLAGSARRRQRTERTTFGVVLAGLAVAGLLTLQARRPLDAERASHAEPDAPRPAPLRMQLPSRDTLVATPGARFELARTEPADRRVELHDGAIAFDVAPLDAGERFAVVTKDLTVRVRGTVFSVAVDERGTEVRVYEGAVVIERAGNERELRQGESYGSDARPVAQDERSPLQREAAALAARRAHEQPRAPAAEAREPEPTQAAALGEPDAPREPAPPAIATASTPDSRGAARGTHAGALAAASRVHERAALPPPGACMTLLEARAWLHDGQAERALAASHACAGTGAPDGEWRLLRADALRSLGRAHEAALAYRDAASRLDGERRAGAGFRAAEILLRELGEPRAALAALHDAAVDAPRSALRERGLLLRIEALERLGEPVREVAARYLAEFPDSAGAPRLRARVERAR